MSKAICIAITFGILWLIMFIAWIVVFVKMRAYAERADFLQTHSIHRGALFPGAGYSLFTGAALCSSYVSQPDSGYVAIKSQYQVYENSNNSNTNNQPSKKKWKDSGSAQWSYCTTPGIGANGLTSWKVLYNDLVFYGQTHTSYATVSGNSNYRYQYVKTGVVGSSYSGIGNYTGDTNGQKMLAPVKLKSGTKTNFLLPGTKTVEEITAYYEKYAKKWVANESGVRWAMICLLLVWLGALFVEYKHICCKKRGEGDRRYTSSSQCRSQRQRRSSSSAKKHKKKKSSSRSSGRARKKDKRKERNSEEFEGHPNTDVNAYDYAMDPNVNYANNPYGNPNMPMQMQNNMMYPQMQQQYGV